MIYDQAVLMDFLATVIWPSRTLRVTTGSEQQFDLVGTWDVDHDTPMAWVDGNRISGTITWINASRVSLPSAVAAGKQVIILVSPGAGSGYLPRTGLAAMLGDLDCGGNRLKHVEASEEEDDGVNRGEVSTMIAGILGANYLLLTGGQMIGGLLLRAANAITGAAEAVRRDMVALRDGTQAFTAKVSGIEATDPAHLATLSNVTAAVAAAVAGTMRRLTIADGLVASSAAVDVTGVGWSTWSCAFFTGSPRLPLWSALTPNVDDLTANDVAWVGGWSTDLSAWQFAMNGDEESFGMSLLGVAAVDADTLRVRIRCRYHDCDAPNTTFLENIPNLDSWTLVSQNAGHYNLQAKMVASDVAIGPLTLRKYTLTFLSDRFDADSRVVMGAGNLADAGQGNPVGSLRPLSGSVFYDAAVSA